MIPNRSQDATALPAQTLLLVKKPEPVVTKTPDGFRFKWKSEAPGSTGAGTTYNNIYTHVRETNGDVVLACRDLSAPKGEEAGGTCAQ